MTINRISENMIDPVFVQKVNDTNQQLAEKLTEAELFADDKSRNTKMVNPMASYLGFVNTEYTTDNGTRVYFMPKAPVTSGIGAGIKIFGDPFHLDIANYRDLGIYFFQDQAGDTGFNGDGVFWLNSKAVGTKYAKNPDIAFSFQDQHVAGRFVYLQNGGSPKMCFVVGKGLPQIFSSTYTTIIQETQGDMAFRNNDMIRWVNTSGLPTSGIKYNVDNAMEFIIGNKSVLKIKNNGSTATDAGRAALEGTIVQANKTVSDNAATIDVKAFGTVLVSNTAATTLTNFTGAISGQKVTLIFSNGQTTIENNATIKLKGAVNYTPTQFSTLELVLMGTVWYETARSVNS